MLLSGGVDSTVCAALLGKALKPEQMIAIHIDNGFMRKGESEQVRQSLERIGIRVHVESAALEFYDGDTTIREAPNPETGVAVTRKTGEERSFVVH